MEAADVPTQLQAAREALQAYHYDDAYRIAFAVHESGVAQGEELGDAAYYVGEACFGLRSMDAAHHYLTEATTTASEENRAKATARLQDIAEYDTAVAAPHDGVDADEATATLAAAEDAMATHNYSDAEQLYQQVYSAAGMDVDNIGRAALGLARVRAYQGQLDEADQYAAFAESISASAPGATELREWIAGQRAANTAVEDGATADEFRRINDAATAAYTAGDYRQAFELSRAVVESPQAPAHFRAIFMFNMAMCAFRLHEFEAAEQYFTDAQANGDADLVARCQHQLEAIARREEALTLAEQPRAEDLPPIP